MSWGKWRKSFFVACAAHCRFEGWKSWFRCTGAGFREIDTFASQFHWDLQFQSCVLRCWTALLHWDLRCRVFARKFTFARNLVENACFGSLDCHFWWKSRGKCSFWKLKLSLWVKVLWKTLVLDAWIVTFGESLVENAFGWKSRGKCSFLEAWIVTLGGKCSFWKLGLWLWVKSRGVQQECQARVSRKTVKEECLGKSVKKECQAKVSSKIV